MAKAWASRRAGQQTDRQEDERTDGQADRQTGRRTDRQTDGQADRQTDGVDQVPDRGSKDFQLLASETIQGVGKAHIIYRNRLLRSRRTTNHQPAGHDINPEKPKYEPNETTTSQSHRDTHNPHSNRPTPTDLVLPDELLSPNT